MNNSNPNVDGLPIRSGRGIQEEQVWAAADALVRDGLRPTIERVRQKIGSGSPNTVSPMLERWFASLGQRLREHGSTSLSPQEDQVPQALMEVTRALWLTACQEAERAQVQSYEANRREIELQRDALCREKLEFEQRQTSFEQSRKALEEALSSSRQALATMEAQMQRQQQSATQALADATAEAQRLRAALDDAAASHAALREKSALELSAALQDIRVAEQRHESNTRRLLNEVDRERQNAKQLSSELEKERKLRAAERDSARIALDATQQALSQEQDSLRDARANWSREQEALKIELATQRERATGAELRVSNLAQQLQELTARSEREMRQLREALATTASALRDFQQLTTAKRLRSRGASDGKKPPPTASEGAPGPSTD